MKWTDGLDLVLAVQRKNIVKAREDSRVQSCWPDESTRCSHSLPSIVPTISPDTLLFSWPTNPKEDAVSNVWTGLV